jgi:tetratricopeptide (TPR) repeat protein
MAWNLTSWRRRAACAAILLFTAAPAWAQAPSGETPTPSASDKARAADLFKKSVEAYRQGALQQAVELLDQAYAIDPQPVLVYNRARAEEALGNVDEAIAGYEKYLQQEPNAVDRGAIEQRLTTLRRQRDEKAALVNERDARAAAPPPAEPPRPTPERAEPPPPKPTVLPIVVAGVGLAGIGVGALLGGLALSKKSDAVNESVQTKAMDEKSSADGLATGSTVSFIVGGVLLVAGATWWFLSRSRSSSHGQLPLTTNVALGRWTVGGSLP